MVKGFYMIASHYLTLLTFKVVSTVVQSYDLLIIEDEATPLASGANHANYYIGTVTIIVIAAIFMLLSYWAAKRKHYVKRYKQLSMEAGSVSKAPLFIKSLSEEIEHLETELSATMI